MGLDKVPVRVDFAGGWLDVPRLAIPGAYIVNCAVTPFMQPDGSPYEPGGGVGGSAAMAILKGQNGVATELKNGAGWQDPAVITETGLCVWESGEKPKLHSRNSGDWLKGLMAIKWMGGKHSTPDLVDAKRDYQKIENAAGMASTAAVFEEVRHLGDAIKESHEAQMSEGMQEITAPLKCIGQKYLGAGHGGYALFLFAKQHDRDAFVQQDGAMAIEPYCRWANG
jgi:mevalonate kinase